MKLTVTKPPEMKFIGHKIERDIRSKVTTKLVQGLRQFHLALRDTPVYTGRTLANYRWSLGEPIDARRAAIANPALPGKTSTLGIGSEPRRAANQALIDAEFEEMVQTILASNNPFQKVFLRNNMPNFDEIEYGTYSEEARTPPGGMTRRGEARFTAVFRGVTKVG